MIRSCGKFVPCYEGQASPVTDRINTKTGFFEFSGIVIGYDEKKPIYRALKEDEEWDSLSRLEKLTAKHFIKTRVCVVSNIKEIVRRAINYAHLISMPKPMLNAKVNPGE